MNFLNVAFVALLQSFESTLGVIGDFFMSLDSHLYLAFASLGSSLLCIYLIVEKISITQGTQTIPTTGRKLQLFERTSDGSKRNAKTGWRLNIRKANVTIPEEIHDFNIDDEDIEITKDFAYLGSVIHSNGDCSQKNREKAETQRRSNGRIRTDHQEQRPSASLYSQLLCTNVGVGQ